MSLDSIITELKNCAERLEAERRQLASPLRQGDADIDRAAKALRAALGKMYFSIKAELSYRFHANGPEVEWTIYAADLPGERFIKAKTLTDAVNLTLAANSPSVETERSVEETLTPSPV